MLIKTIWVQKIIYITVAVAAVTSLCDGLSKVDATTKAAQEHQQVQHQPFSRR